MTNIAKLSYEEIEYLIANNQTFKQLIVDDEIEFRLNELNYFLRQNNGLDYEIGGRGEYIRIEDANEFIEWYPKHHEETMLLSTTAFEETFEEYKRLIQQAEEDEDFEEYDEIERLKYELEDEMIDSIKRDYNHPYYMENYELSEIAYDNKENYKKYYVDYKNDIYKLSKIA